MNDLFGNEITVEEARAEQLRGKRNEMARGYAGTPGSGPAGERCEQKAFRKIREVIRRKGGWSYEQMILLGREVL